MRPSTNPSNKEPRRRPPATTPEAKENQMISLAVDLAEKQLAQGSASSQVITHFLKLGTTMAQLEKKKLEQEVKLVEAKTESILLAKRVEELYINALNAMKAYSGSGEEYDD